MKLKNLLTTFLVLITTLSLKLNAATISGKAYLDPSATSLITTEFLKNYNIYITKYDASYSTIIDTFNNTTSSTGEYSFSTLTTGYYTISFDYPVRIFANSILTMSAPSREIRFEINAENQDLSLDLGTFIIPHISNNDTEIDGYVSAVAIPHPDSFVYTYHSFSSFFNVLDDDTISQIKFKNFPSEISEIKINGIVYTSLSTINSDYPDGFEIETDEDITGLFINYIKDEISIKLADTMKKAFDFNFEATDKLGYTRELSMYLNVGKGSLAGIVSNDGNGDSLVNNTPSSLIDGFYINVVNKSNNLIEHSYPISGGKFGPSSEVDYYNDLFGGLYYLCLTSTTGDRWTPNSITFVLTDLPTNGFNIYYDNELLSLYDTVINYDPNLLTIISTSSSPDTAKTIIFKYGVVDPAGAISLNDASYQVIFSNPLNINNIILTAQENNCDILTSWNKNIVYNTIEIEGSIDNNSFHTIAKIHDQSNEFLIHNNHYRLLRLKAYDENQNVKYSNIVKLENNNCYKNISIYPNPAYNTLIVNQESDNTIYETYEIMDITGKIALKDKLNNDTDLINISALNNGFYYIKLSNKTDIIIKEFIKK